MIPPLPLETLPMRLANLIFALTSTFLVASPVQAMSFADLTQTDAVSGLRDGLAQGAAKAISQLGSTNGFLGNDQVKIPLPDALRRVQSGLRLLGMQRQADELVVAMNRAAEQAVPEARILIESAIRNMSVRDAKGILTGGDTAATEYFRRVTSDQLTERFLPIVTRITAQIGLAEQYNRLAARGAQFGLINEKQARIEDYVTQKALDGLFLIIAEQERAIRRDPVGAATGMAQRVFGLLRY